LNRSLQQERRCRQAARIEPLCHLERDEVAVRGSCRIVERQAYFSVPGMAPRLKLVGNRRADASDRELTLADHVHELGASESTGGGPE
jgi:hypothetical protein